MGIGRVIQKGNQELPQLKGASPLVRGPLTIHGGLLFDFACVGQRHTCNTLTLIVSGNLGQKELTLICSVHKTEGSALTSLSLQLSNKPDRAAHLPVSREQHKCHRSTTGDLFRMENLKEKLKKKDHVA